MLRHLARRFPYPYVLQEGLGLALYYGNPYDFRALVQKGASGRWQVAGLVARIAPEGGVITSPRSGGLVASPDRVLAHSFGPPGGRKVLGDLAETCIRIAQRLEDVYGRCVELGLDMGVTRDGRVKLIEANGRPLKVSLSRLRDAGVDAAIFRYPVHYAAALDMP